jgi:hypothetical protein
MKFLCLFSITIAVALCGGSNASMAIPNNLEKSTMKNQSVNIKAAESMATFCMGRFLIDVPVGSKFSGGNYKYDFIKIEPVKSASLEEFEKEVEKAELNLKLTEHKYAKKRMLLQSVQIDKNTKLLASWKTNFSTAEISIVGYHWDSGNRFLFQRDVDDDKQEPGMNRMREAISRLRARADNDIPTEPGYCFAGGFIVNPRWRNEEASLDIDIAGHPDAFVSIWIYPLASYKHDKPLLERMGGMTQFLGNLATSVHVLRKGDRQLGPYRGQEHLASAPNSGGMRGHAFVWETQGDGTLDTPAIKIELTTGHQDDKGNPQKTSLTDEQAMKLWDDILNSFRLRPTGDSVKTSDATPEPSPRLPLGELAATGRACPQTGWWQASEAGEIEGGVRRYFRAGEMMPQVTMLGESSLWQKLKGARPSYRTATVWKLVDFDPTPIRADEVPRTQAIAQAAPDGATPNAGPDGEPSRHDKG